MSFHLVVSSLILKMFYSFQSTSFLLLLWNLLLRILFYLVLRIEHRILFMVSMHSPTELHPLPLLSIFCTIVNSTNAISCFVSIWIVCFSWVSPNSLYVSRNLPLSFSYLIYWRILVYNNISSTFISLLLCLSLFHCFFFCLFSTEGQIQGYSITEL